MSKDESKVEISAEDARVLSHTLDVHPREWGEAAIRVRQALAEHERQQNPLRLPWRLISFDGLDVVTVDGTRITESELGADICNLLHAAPDLLAVVESFFKGNINAPAARAALKKARGEKC